MLRSVYRLLSEPQPLADLRGQAGHERILRPAQSFRQSKRQTFLAREGRAPNGAGRVPVGEPEPPELVVWHEFLDQRKELSLLKPDVCIEQRSRRSQRLSIDAAGRHRDFEFASEPLELHVLDACLAKESRLRRDVPEQKREELFFLIAKVDTLFVPEELPEFPGRGKPSGCVSVRCSTAQPHCLHESIVMVVRERDQGGVALHSTTLGCTLAAEELQDAIVAAFEEAFTTETSRLQQCSGMSPEPNVAGLPRES